MTLKEIGEIFNVSRQRISAFLKKRRVIKTSKRKKVMEEVDNCQLRYKGICSDDSLQIHHINFNPSDNRVENLVVVCRDCHVEVHRIKKSFCSYCNKIGNKIVSSAKKKYGKICQNCYDKIKIHPGRAKGTKINVNWSAKHDKCLRCKTTNIRHKGQGLCKRCYSLFSYYRRKVVGIDKYILF